MPIQALQHNPSTSPPASALAGPSSLSPSEKHSQAYEPKALAASVPVKRPMPTSPIMTKHKDEPPSSSLRPTTPLTDEPESNSEIGTADTSHGTSGAARRAKKKKANRACAACQKAHLTCDDARPCSRCVKKGIGDQCTDGKRKRAKYLLDEDELEAVKAKERQEKEDKERLAAIKSEEHVHEDPSIPPGIAPDRQQQADYRGELDPSSSYSMHTSNSSDPFASLQNQQQQGLPQQQLPNTFFPSIDQPVTSQPPDIGDVFTQGPFASAPSDLSVHPNNTPPYAFGSESTSLEYSILSAMLNGIDPSLISGSTDGPEGLGAASGDVPPSANGNGTIGVTPSMELNSFFNGNATAAGSGLPSVGMASDFSSPWLTTPAQSSPATGSFAPSAASGANAWATADPNQAAFANTACGGKDDRGQQSVRLKAIGGGEGPPPPGNIESGGFKAYQVPSPSPSTASAHLGGLESNRSASTPPELTTAGGNGPNAATASALAKPHHPSAFESQWRDRVNHIYASLTRPFPYTEGYHFLLKYVTDNFEKADVLRIVRALGLFRPSLIALQMPLTEEDEIFVERSIQRTILEFEKLISFSGTPTVVWRRTCEICVVGSEFSMLTGWTRDSLLGRRIYEFWDKDSTLEYWDKFAMHAFENTSQSIVANVVLKRPDGSSVPCAACFSIKRNVFDLPSLVVGAFLPILSST